MDEWMMKVGKGKKGRRDKGKIDQGGKNGTIRIRKDKE